MRQPPPAAGPPPRAPRRARAASEYPLAPERDRALGPLCAANGFTMRDVLQARRRACCEVLWLPPTVIAQCEPRAPACSDYYYAHDNDGYVLVRPRGAHPRWPSARGGQHLPLRVTRWRLDSVAWEA